MSINTDNDIDILEAIYLKTKQLFFDLKIILEIFFIRLRKFFALPYCYFKFIDWKECTASPYKVFIDFLYIFFVLKYYPENYGYCRLWEKEKTEWKYYYGSNYDAYQKYKLEKTVQKKEFQILFEDKEVCHQLCLAGDLNVPDNYGTIDASDDFFSKIKEVFIKSKKNKLIIKPVRGSAGQGILFAEKIDNLIAIKNKSKILNPNNLILSEKCIVQEFIEQDLELSIITSSASIRIITLYTKSNGILILSAEILTAVNNNFLSNWCAGGITISVDIVSGKLNKLGYDKYGHKYEEHPTSKIIFNDYQMPKWKEIKDFAIKIQKTFPYYRMLGPDITLSKTGPILYEINATPDLSSTEQSCGPFLENERILKEFIEYDLLINNAFKKK